MQTNKTVLSLAALCLAASGASASAGFAPFAARQAAARFAALTVLSPAASEQLGAGFEIATPAHRAAGPVASDPNAKDDDGTTELMRAAWNGENARITSLLALPGIKVDETDGLGRTALMMAAIQGRTEAARLLLAAKADPKAIERQSKETALMIAASLGHTKTAAVLLEGGSDINAANAAGDNALILSLLGGRYETVDLLASARGADLNARNAAGTTALLKAATSPSLGQTSADKDVIALLIDRGADKDLTGNFSDYQGNAFAGYTPLMAAAYSQNVEGVKTLLAKKVNFDYRDAASGLTALGVAKGRGALNQEIIDLLTAWGAHE